MPMVKFRDMSSQPKRETSAQIRERVVAAGAFSNGGS